MAEVNLRHATLVAATILAIAACQAEAPGNQSGRGAELLMPFKMELKQALQAGMSEGPEQAIEVCRVKAPEIAAALAVDGVRMGRASHKLRNAGNTGPEWTAPVLAGYLESGGREPVEVALENGYIGYAEPIAIQPLCLVCHGETLAPGIAAKLSELYPDDMATGFQDGDFRGIFWVEYPTRK